MDRELPDPSGAAPIHETYLYYLPRVLDTRAGEVKLDLLLSRLGVELGLPGALLRPDAGGSVTVPGDPADVWRALEQISSYWTQRELFLIPGVHGRWPGDL